jgi:hypothetical protein
MMISFLADSCTSRYEECPDRDNVICRKMVEAVLRYSNLEVNILSRLEKAIMRFSA